MTNLVKKQFSAPANIANMAQSLQNSAANASSGGGDGSSYLRFSRAGEWSFGREQIEPEEGSLWAINPGSFKHGWIAWGTKEHGTNGKKAGEQMVSATEPMPDKYSLPQVQGEWAQAIEMSLQCVSGEDEGTSVIYNTNSVGGRNCYATVVQAVVEQVAKNPEYFVPVVELENSSYKHDSYGTIYTPLMRVVKWVDINGEEAGGRAPAIEEQDSDVEETEEEAPRRRRRRA